MFAQSRKFSTIKEIFHSQRNFLQTKIKKVYDQCFKDKHLYDFSGYPKDSAYYGSLNKNMLGKMKDELNGNKIVEFVGLKSKTH